MERAGVLTMALAKGGRGIAKRIRKTVRMAELINVQALNKVAKWAETQTTRELSDLLNVTQAKIRKVRKIYRATRKYPVFRVFYRRRAFDVKELRGTRFVQLKGGGRLTFRAYRKKQVFHNVSQRTRWGETHYTVPRTESRRGARKWKHRRIVGTWIKADYRGPAKVKRRVRKRYHDELERLKRLKLPAKT